MGAILLKAVAFVFIIALGYVLKRFRVFGENDYRIVSTIVLKITLPAAVVTSFASFTRDDSLWILVGLGLVCNIFMLVMGWLYSRKMDPSRRAFFMLGFPGYNIGAFTLPFVQSFLGAFGVVATCMFDTGNSIMCTGTSYTITKSILNSAEEGRLTPKVIFKRLFSSVPFDTYLLMLLLVLFNIRLPEPVVAISSTIGAANGFMAMLMIGMMFRFEAKPSYLKDAGVTLLVRYIFAAILAYLFYFHTPFSLQVRQVLAIVAFAPIPALTPAFVDRCKGDAGLASFTGSVSIIISIVIMTILVSSMNLGT